MITHVEYEAFCGVIVCDGDVTLDKVVVRVAGQVDLVWHRDGGLNGVQGVLLGNFVEFRLEVVR